MQVCLFSVIAGKPAIFWFCFWILLKIRQKKTQSWNGVYISLSLYLPKYWTKTKNTTKYRANTFGFYPINGKPVIEFYENSKVPSVRGFLRRIKEKNPGKHTVVIWDNAPQHKAAEVRRFAESIGITLVFLPKYSPDLDPIEFLWKSLRRRISQIGFIGSEWSFKESIRTAFHRLAKGKSFMSGWLEKFGPYFSNLLCPWL